MTNKLTHSRYVATYQHAYGIPGSTTLCERCYKRWLADKDSLNIPRLGPVNHGLHRGTCDVQLAEWDAQLGQPYADD